MKPKQQLRERVDSVTDRVLFNIACLLHYLRNIQAQNTINNDSGR